MVERCFGPQCKSHVVRFGGGITIKELKGGTTSKAALLEELKITHKRKRITTKVHEYSREQIWMPWNYSGSPTFITFNNLVNIYYILHDMYLIFWMIFCCIIIQVLLGGWFIVVQCNNLHYWWARKGTPKK